MSYQFGNPLYGISISNEDWATGKTSSKTINGLNIPAGGLSTGSLSAVAEDLHTFSAMLMSVSADTFKDVKFNTSRTVVPSS